MDENNLEGEVKKRIVMILGVSGIPIDRHSFPEVCRDGEVRVVPRQDEDWRANRLRHMAKLANRTHKRVMRPK